MRNETAQKPSSVENRNNRHRKLERGLVLFLFALSSALAYNFYQQQVNTWVKDPEPHHASLHATDNARWLPSLFENDLAELPSIVRDTAVQIELNHPDGEYATSCNGVLVQINPDPINPNLQIDTIFTAGHCLNGPARESRTAVIYKPLTGEKYPGFDVGMATGSNDFGVVAITTPAHTAVQLSPYQIISTSPLDAASPFSTLCYTDYAYQNSGIFPAQLQLLTPDPITIPGSDQFHEMSALVTNHAGAFGCSGLGLFDHQGRLVGTQSGSISTKEFIYDIYSPIPPDYQSVISTAITALLAP